MAGGQLRTLYGILILTGDILEGLTKIEWKTKGSFRRRRGIGGIILGSDMTTSEDGPARLSTTPKKRFIGKAKAEALRKKASENQAGGNIEDGVITLKGAFPSRSLDIF